MQIPSFPAGIGGPSRTTLPLSSKPVVPPTEIDSCIGPVQAKATSLPARVTSDPPQTPIPEETVSYVEHDSTATCQESSTRKPAVSSPGPACCTLRPRTRTHDR